MANKINKYVGARYVPLHTGGWDSTKAYEALSVVTFLGASYTSKTFVPVGANITNEMYWVCTGNYNAQVELYRQEVLGFNDRIHDVETEIDNVQNELYDKISVLNGSVILAKANGLIGDGVVNDYDALSTLITNIGSAEVEIFFAKGIYKINTTIDIPKNICLSFANGAMLSPSVTVQVVINGAIKADIQQIFTGLGSIRGDVKVNEIYPQWFGAKGDNIADDTTAIQKAINLAMESAVTLSLPSGFYKVSSSLIFDNSLSEYFLDSKKINVKGGGIQTTRINYTGTGKCLEFIGGKTGILNSHMYQNVVEGFTLMGSLQIGSIAISCDNTSFMHFKDICITLFDYGFECKGVDNQTFTKVVVEYNKHGYYFTFGTTCPNAITFLSCNFIGNSEYGLFATRPSSFNFYGGNVEGNGMGGAGSVKGGLLFYDGCVQGGVGCDINGMYFESNMGLGDITIVNENAMVFPYERNEGVYNISGCSFNRATLDYYCTFNIFVNFNSSIAGQQKVVVTGCAFRNYNAYTPHGARLHVGFSADSRTIDNCYIKGIIQTNDVEKVLED